MQLRQGGSSREGVFRAATQQVQEASSCTAAGVGVSASEHLRSGSPPSLVCQAAWLAPAPASN